MRLVLAIVCAIVATSAEADVGIGVSAKTDSASVYIPITVKRFMFEPYVRATEQKSESSSTTGTIFSTTTLSASGDPGPRHRCGRVPPGSIGRTRNAVLRRPPRPHQPTVDVIWRGLGEYRFTLLTVVSVWHRRGTRDHPDAGIPLQHRKTAFDWGRDRCESHRGGQRYDQSFADWFDDTDVKRRDNDERHQSRRDIALLLKTAAERH